MSDTQKHAPDPQEAQGQASVGRALAAASVGLAIVAGLYYLTKPEPVQVAVTPVSDASPFEQVLIQHIEELREAGALRVRDAAPSNSGPPQYPAVLAAPTSTAPVPKAIHIPAKVVVKFGQAQSMHTTPAAGPEGGIRGVRLSGVSGSGLVDGDVVTEIEGSAINDPSDGVLAVVAAVQAGKKVISATVERNGTPIHVTVEVPSSIPGAKNPLAGKPEAGTL